MKRLKQIFGLLILMVIMASFSQCASTYKLQKKAPTSLGEAYFEQWVSGMAQGPSGINIFINVNDDKIQLDSVYFRGKAAKLDADKSNKQLYIGRFVSKSTEIRDNIMHNEGKEEYGNQAPEIPKKIPFELKANECIVSYRLNGKTLYYKIPDLKQKESKDHPM